MVAELFPDSIDARARSFRATAFGLIAGWILLSPALAQLCDLSPPFVRPWIMFRDVGIGILKGDFIVADGDSETRLSPLDVLGRDRYPVERQPYRFENRVLRDGDLAAFAADFCRMHPDVDLRFAGKVGAAAAWRPLAGDDLCEGPIP